MKKNRTKIWFVISVVVLSVVFMNLMPQTVFAQEEPKESELYAKSCALLDGDSGRVLYGKQENNPMANASTTKIMTCILTLEVMDLDTVAVVSQNAAAQPKVHLGMSEGEQYYLRDLLYAMMLESFNDCAVAIAETVAGTTENFAKMMNQKAQLLGCKDTYFITPNGLDAEDEFGFHHTTAEDLCRIMSYCVWNSPKADEFLKITQTSEYQFQSLEGKNCTAVNRNAFLHMMDGVLSGKTGFTANAGYCYVAALEKDGRKFCIALLACGWPNNRTYKWSDAKKLLQYALDCYHYADVEQVTELPEITVRNAKTRQSSLKDFRQNMLIVPIADDSQLPKQYLLKDGQQITHQILVNQEVTAPVKEDDIVGEIDYYLDDELIAQLPVYAGCNLQSWDFSALMKSLVMKYLL